MLLQLGREKLHVSAFLYSLSLMIISHSPLCLVADNDECTVRHQTCPSTSVCRNTDGSFVCDCPVGYTGDGRTGCTVTGNCAICTGYLTDCSQEYAIGLERTMTLVTFYPWNLCQVVFAYRMRWINHCTSKFAKTCFFVGLCFSICHRLWIFVYCFTESTGVTVISCPRPIPPTNGYVSSGDFDLSDILTFSCGTGFSLVGNATTTCLATGLASNPPPTCQGTVRIISSAVGYNVMVPVYSL